MKRLLTTLASLTLICSVVVGQNNKDISLPAPQKEGGKPIMEAFNLRASATQWDTVALKLQDISNLLWAANGINRPESGKRTAPSALNRQEVLIYAFLPDGVYVYDHLSHSLKPYLDRDLRGLFNQGPRKRPNGALKPGERPKREAAGEDKRDGRKRDKGLREQADMQQREQVDGQQRQQTDRQQRQPIGGQRPMPPRVKDGQSPALVLLLVADLSKFDGAGHGKDMCLMDAAIVSQNINLFCSGMGFLTRTRAGMDKELISKVLNLPENQLPLINLPVSYPVNK